MIMKYLLNELRFSLNNSKGCTANSCRSPDLDLLATTCVFGMDGLTRDAIGSGVCISRGDWKDTA